MKRTINFLIFATIASLCNAQQLEIASPLSHAGSVGAASVPTDNNGNPCAKIIVEASIDGIEIEGSYIVGDAVKTTGKYELFVAIPKKQGHKITLLHDKYGSLDISLWTDDGALIGREAYRVKLKPIQEDKVLVDMHGNKVDVADGNFEIVKHEDAGGQYLVMQIKPTDASVEIDGQFVSVKNGVLQKFLSYGSHSYRVYHPMYEDKTGSVSVNNEKVSVNIDLAPIFGFMQISSAPEMGADVYIDGKRVGQTPFKTDALKEGGYMVRVAKEMYEPKEESVIVKRGETVSVKLEMIPTFGNITITCADNQATILMNGRILSNGSWTGRLERGRYQIEAQRQNYRSTTKNIDVDANSQQKFTIDAPTPMVGSLNISSDPVGAKIKVDGKDMGETPNIISGLLIGSHTVSLSKQGCGDYEKIITIEEGKITPLEVALEQGKEITFTTDQNGDEIYINSAFAGTSPLTTSLSFGSHTVYAKRGSEKTGVEKVNVTTSISNSMTLSFGLGKINGHEWVDLGLPSGLKWATCNVGANSPEEYGDYFAWGETTTKSEYTEYNSESYGYGKNNSWLKRNGYIDSKGVLTKDHDAASVNWGSTWRMPTQTEIDELVENTTTEWTTRNGVEGRLVKSKRNGNSIFIPTAGWRDGAQLIQAGVVGHCWSSTPHESNPLMAYCLDFYYGNFCRGSFGRGNGQSVRPVSDNISPDNKNKIDGKEPINKSFTLKPTGTIGGHEYVDLGLPSGLKWATCNIGANSPEEYGDYFAWGETKIKESYTEGESKTCEKNSSWLKNNGYIDSKGNLKKNHDAANTIWGSTWRMPTKEEVDELITNTTSEWVSINGVSGCLVTSNRNGNSIFLPAAGLRYATNLYNAGDYSDYWSSSTNEENLKTSFGLNSESNKFNRDIFGRGGGFPVRPVSK